MKARVVTLNLWGDRAPLEERLALCAAGLAGADAILLQEVRQGAGLANTAATLCSLLGDHYTCVYQPAVSGPSGTWGPGSTAGEEGLAVLSRLPVEDVSWVKLPHPRPREVRILLSVRLAFAGASLWVHNTHLHWRPSDDDARLDQVLAAVEHIDWIDHAGAHVLGGDFNAGPDSPALRVLLEEQRGRMPFVDLYASVTGSKGGFTFAERNPNTHALARLGLDRRIDFLLGNRAVTCVDAGLCVDAPKNGLFASDHFGVWADITATRD